MHKLHLFTYVCIYLVMSASMYLFMKMFAYLLKSYHQNSNAIVELYAPLLSTPQVSFMK